MIDHNNMIILWLEIIIYYVLIGKHHRFLGTGHKSAK